MFDNPNEELKKLEAQLLAAEDSGNDNFEVFYRGILEEFGPEQEAAKKQKQTSAHKKSPQSATGNSKKSGKKGTKKGSKKHSKKDKSIQGLVITLCVECAGIVAVLLWWVLRFL